MMQVPETRQDIKRLLYEQVPLLIKKLEVCSPAETAMVIQSIAEVIAIGETIPG